MFWHDVGESILYDALGTKISWKAFVRAFSLVSSRAFVIDVFHGYVSLFPVRWAFCQPAFPSYSSSDHHSRLHVSTSPHSFRSPVF